MLVIVSDFHFSDGTAVPAYWNVNPRGIELLLRDVYRQAARKGVNELYLVLLGDMFDTLRSEQWLEVPLAERPWGDPRALDDSYLLPAAFAPEERALVDETLDQLGLPQDPGFYRAAALLYWLQFAATNLSRYPSFQRDHVWMRNNVFLVLKRGLS